MTDPARPVPSGAATDRPADLPIRDAATVIVLRRGPAGASVLMGQRGAGAVFMPSKYVFPGGARDPGDSDVPLARPLDPLCAARLGPAGPALAATAIRELYEETGLCLGLAADWPDAPSDWAGFAARGLRPDAGPLTFIFRAITPTGRPRRFDARFFLLDAEALSGDPDDFSAATDELTHLHWVPLTQARALDLPFITEVVLAEVAALLARGLPRPGPVPFFDNSGSESRFLRIA